MHLVIYFCGTGNSGKDFASFEDYLTGNRGVWTIKVKGCDKPEVCGNGIFPDLKGFAQRFTRTLFSNNSKDKTVTLATTNSEVLYGIGIEKAGLRIDLTLESISKKPDKMTNAIEQSLNKRTNTNIESITLCGYSRGAVTCFEVARVLYEEVPHIPVNIVADQPVPGNLYSLPGSNVNSVIDCSDLNNLKNVSIILGAYTGERQAMVDLHTKATMPDKNDLKNYKKSYLFVKDQFYYVNSDSIAAPCETPQEYCNWSYTKYFKTRNINPLADNKYSIPSREMADIAGECDEEALYESGNYIDRQFHRAVFSQVVPKLPKLTECDITVLPHEHHNDQQINDPFGSEHMHWKILELFVEQGLVKEKYLKNQIRVAENTYHLYENYQPKLYPPLSDVQAVWGIPAKELYQYIDKLHPMPNLRKGWSWNHKKQSLSSWWNEQDKKVSFLSSPLPVTMMKKIEEIDTITDMTDRREKLKNLYVTADYWLLNESEGFDAVRIEQVENLRNNIMDHLSTAYNCSQIELHLLNREIMHNSQYFLKYWKEGCAKNSYSFSSSSFWSSSSSASESTDYALDKAFKDHASADINNLEIADKELFNTLSEWIQENKKNHSKYYDLVSTLFRSLEKIINICYGTDFQFDEKPEYTRVKLCI